MDESLQVHHGLPAFAHDRNVAIDIQSPLLVVAAPYQRSDRPLALQREAKVDEERGRGGEVGNHDADVIHALDRHGHYGSGTTGRSAKERIASRLAPRDAAV